MKLFIKDFFSKCDQIRRKLVTRKVGRALIRKKELGPSGPNWESENASVESPLKF